MSKNIKSATGILCAVCAFVALALATADCNGQVSEHRNRVETAIESAISFHQQSRNMPRRVDAIEEKERLYFSMATSLDLAGEIDHLDIPHGKRNAVWAVNSRKVAAGIKPHAAYEVVKSRGTAYIHGSEDVSSRLSKHIKYISWYRSQLEQSFDNERTDRAAKAICVLIDEFLDEFAGALPKIKVQTSGELTNDGRQKLSYSDSKVWNILASLNRFFFYKFQMNPGRDDFHRADFLLIEAMVKTSAIYGSRPPATGIQEIGVQLSSTGRGWKSAAHQALESWEDFTEMPEETGNICVIRIPAKPSQDQPKEEEPEETDESSFPSDVEDIKEIGDKIFLKRNGRWEPWEG